MKDLEILNSKCIHKLRASDDVLGGEPHTGEFIIEQPRIASRLKGRKPGTLLRSVTVADVFPEKHERMARGVLWDK